MDLETYKPWLGKTEELTQTVDVWPIHGLLAALDETDRLDVNEIAPLLSQWLYFGPTVPHSQIATDGHPRRGGFLPPIALPRRMWASSDIIFHRRFEIGATVRKTARIADISLRQGGSGPPVFVKVANTYWAAAGAPLLEESQTLVYRDHPKPDEPAAPGKQALTGAQWSESVQPDEALLFRYSAVTFNAHRIHYDRPYAVDVEGYSGILVQGQLIATLMLRALERAHSERRIASFSFRGVQPIFCGERIAMEGIVSQDGAAELWARDDQGILRMAGKATLS